MSRRAGVLSSERRRDEKRSNSMTKIILS
jgi:hypothetical protein